MSHSSPPSTPGLQEAPATGPFLPAPAMETMPPVIRLDERRRAEPPTVSRARCATWSGMGTVRALIVEDDGDDCLLIHELLGRAERTRFDVEHTSTVAGGLARLGSDEFDICLVDHFLPDGDGLTFLRQAAQRGIATPMILISGQHQPELDVDAIAAGATDYIEKEEFDVQRLERAVRLALTRQRRAEERAILRLSGSPGEAAGMLFLDRLERAVAVARRHRALAGVLSLRLAPCRNGRRLDQAVAGRLVETIGGRVSGTLRRTDSVTLLGEDQLAIVVEEAARPEHVALVAQMVLDAVAAESGPAGWSSGPASLGVALFPLDADDPAMLHRLAQAAMERAADLGGSRCCFHDERLERQVRAESALARELRAAIEANTLALHFQPQVTLCSPALGLASLVRWQHPEFGLIDQERIRTIAETAGLLEPLTDWTIAAACRQASRWQNEGLRQLHVAVPLFSRRQLAWSDLPERLDLHLSRAGIASGRLEIEVDERLLLGEFAEGGTVLQRIRDLGVRLAVDSFGDNATSLNALHRTPVTTVKLARSMLQGMTEQPERRQFAAAVIGLARQLGLRVVAYGADSHAQLPLLRNLGCDAVQSLVSCPPLPAEACRDWLRQAGGRS